MSYREQKYTKYLGLDLWIGTWNVNGKKVEEDISKWLFAEGSQRTDIFVLGLEEMVDLTASTVVSESQSQKRSQMWLEMVQTALRQSRQSDVAAFNRCEPRRMSTTACLPRFWWACFSVCLPMCRFVRPFRM